MSVKYSTPSPSLPTQWVEPRTNYNCCLQWVSLASSPNFRVCSAPITATDSLDDVWPEWNDGDVYREKWDSGKAPDDPKKPPVLNVKETIVKLKRNTNRHLLHFPFFFFYLPYYSFSLRTQRGELVFRLLWTCSTGGVPQSFLSAWWTSTHGSQNYIYSQL